MKNFLFALLLLISFITPTMAQKEVPIIDREIFFGNPEISGGQISPDGRWIAFMKEYNGILNVWVKSFDEPFSKAKVLTNNERPLGGYFWTNDSKYILFIKDTGGDENFNIYAVDPKGSPDAKTGVPASRNLTPMKEVTAQIYSVSKKNPDLLFVGINDRDKAWHDLYRLSISTGKLDKIFENKERITGWDYDWDENVRLAYRTDDNGFSQILRVDGDNKFTKIYETNLKEQAYVAAWTKDNSKMYLVSNKGDVNLSTLFLMDPKTQKIEKVESDPKNQVDFGGASFDDNTREMLYTTYTYDKTEIRWKNKEWEANYKFLVSKFPKREISFASSNKDYSKMLIAVSGDKYATEVYYFNTKTKELIHQYTPKPKLKAIEEHLVEMKPIKYKSSDGLEINGYLTLPKGKKKNLPLVMLVHGGPKGPRDVWGYNPYAQILANRGYAVMQPNFRASGGYGKKFLNAGDKEWGKKMQDDITWGVKYLITQGIADKNKIAIMGGSYGGYATLAGLAFTPDIYACGVDIVGPSNIFTLLESIPAYWESGRKWLYEMTGDPETAEGKKLITEASPLFHTDKIVKPLLIIQGANDPRVKQAESDQIVVAMREKGKDVQYLLANDEGHGFRKPVNNMAMWVTTEKFLAKYLGGRYQESMTDEVAKRLKEITVDIQKVALKKKESLSISEIPTIKTTWKEASYDYDFLIEVQGQSIPMKLTRTISPDGKNWKITEKTSGMMGDIEDNSVYDAAFNALKRESKQGAMTMTMEILGDKAKITAMGKSKDVAKPEGYIADATGMDMFIANLPLKEGYSLAYNTIDMQSAKDKQMLLKVAGKDVFNGFDCMKVVCSSAEDENETTTYWIDLKQKMAVKVEQIVPAMQGAKITITKK